RGETVGPREFAFQVAGELLNDGIAPAGLGSFLRDRLADIPVEGDDLVVYGAGGGDARAADALLELGEESAVLGGRNGERHQRITPAIVRGHSDRYALRPLLPHVTITTSRASCGSIGRPKASTDEAQRAQSGTKR